MDSKTRVLMALNHEKPDKVPFNFWMDRREMAKYEQEIGHRHWRVTHYGADVIESFHCLSFPSGPTIERDGTAWITEPYLKSWSNIATISLPDPNDDRVYELLKADLDEFPNKAVLLNITMPWGVIASWRTYENVYTDMCEYPEEFKKLSKNLEDVMKVVVERACQMGVTAVYIQEDLASSQGLTMSPAMIREFCFGYTKSFIDIAHSYGKPVLFHCDGNVIDFIDILLEYDIQAINPLQANLVDPREFKKRHNNDIAVYGAIDNCFIIPNETLEKIREHVFDVFDVLGKPDGALIMSTHDIPFETPRENIEAMIQAIKECVYD